MFYIASLTPYAGERLVYIIIILTSLKYTVHGQGLARPDHQGEDNMQTHH